jgi:hypothetical protein
MRTIGKGLQIIGLVLLPVACLTDLSAGTMGRSSGLATMLILMVFGALVFGLGRLVEGYAGRSSL